ncbi:MAG: thioredoxin domain-containing protein, partial [Candidatus Eremiobacteraeota bacterium]|nr:thioredoxin domain-containing protein [Candidatus Eremiobacteraeota bacterium]
IRVLAQLVVLAPTQEFHATLVSAAQYVRTVLRDPATGFFAGSQDADEAYFALPLEERQRREAPFVDRTSYTNWTCALAGAWFLAARALDDDAMMREGCQTLDGVHERLLDSDGLAHHFIAADGTPQIRGLLSDQVAYLRALVDAHETSGEPRFLQRALALATTIVERFAAPEGGFYDRLSLEPQLGRLGLLDRPIGDNAIVAETLLRLSALTAQPQLRTHAERALALYARTYAAAGSFAAAYGRALRRLLSPERSVRIVGDPAATDDIREAAFRLPSPHVAIRTVLPADAAGLDLPAEPQPAAYVCAGTACGAPVTGAGDLRIAYDRLEPVASR